MTRLALANALFHRQGARLLCLPTPRFGGSDRIRTCMYPLAFSWFEAKRHTDPNLVPMDGIEPPSLRYQHRAKPLSYTGVVSVVRFELTISRSQSE